VKGQTTKTLTELRGQLQKVRSDGNGGFLALCPVHEDHDPSLHVWTDEAGHLAYCCLAGCEHDQVSEALGITQEDGDDWTPRGPAIAEYRYTDEDGALLYTVCRTADKQFPCWQPDPTKPHDKSWTMKGARRVLYRLPDVLPGIVLGEPVYITEGEKDADALAMAGAVATCNPGGAGKWRSEYAEVMRGALVTIVRDKDEPGRKHAEQVRTSLEGIARQVVVVEAKAGKDAADHLAAGHGLDEFVIVDGVSEKIRLPWMTAAQLATMVLPEPEYIAPPYVARNLVAQLVGKTKGGKTEWARRLAAAVLLQKLFLGQLTTYCPVAYLTEESPASFGPPLQSLGIAGREDLHILFRNACDSGMEWCDMVADMRPYVREHGIGLVIVDTSDPWMLRPGDDPSDPVTAEAAVRELQLLAGENVAVLLLRHERKGGGDIADAGRGSSAFAGAVDVLLSLRRVQGSGHENRRELEAVARAALTVPARAIIELQDGEYLVKGDARDVERQDARALILDHLPRSRDAAVPVDELRESTSTAKTITDDVLRALISEGIAHREKGAGGASSRAFGYWTGETDE
jgi:hypothetical protein